MAANISPIFPNVPVRGWGLLTTQTDPTMTGVGTVLTLLTAGANGTRLDSIVYEALGTNVASVLYLYLNNGSAPTTAANNSLIKQIPLPATTANAAYETVDVRQLMDIAMAPGDVLLASLGTAVAAGWQITALGGNY